MKPDHIPSQELTDETLCRLAASGDRVAEERLVMRYNRLVRMCARPYFLAGGDSEDLIQEGMVGLLAAIREYDSSKAAVFRTYAEPPILQAKSSLRIRGVFRRTPNWSRSSGPYLHRRPATSPNYPKIHWTQNLQSSVFWASPAPMPSSRMPRPQELE